MAWKIGDYVQLGNRHGIVEEIDEAEGVVWVNFFGTGDWVDPEQLKFSAIMYSDSFLTSGGLRLAQRLTTMYR